MKITQIMYTNEAAGLSCRGEDRFLPYGEALCLAGRAIPTARPVSYSHLTLPTI